MMYPGQTEAEAPDLSALTPHAGEELLKECYDRSLQLLRDNSRPFGIIASRQCEKSVCRHYASIFGRDASISVLGMVVSGDAKLVRSARMSLLTLAERQAANGQIPNYVKPEAGEVDYWYFGCIDATLWWLIAVAFYDRVVPAAPLSGSLSPVIDRALKWLLSQEHQALFLLQQNEASDWADVMPRSGFVLYSNSLWHCVKKLYGLPAAAETGRYFDYIFYPFGNDVVERRRARVLVHYIRNVEKCRDFYLSFVNFSTWGREVDVFGNILALLAGPADTSKALKIMDALAAAGATRPHPVRVVLNPLRKGSCLWRPYMERHRQNMPYQYHNGGIWPFVGGFWVALLAKMKREEDGWRALERVALANRLNGWEFNEWLHGKTGEPLGMSGQSWNAAMFILAFHALRDGIRVPG
ncbi:MAG: glycoside hydrolase 100 family protein [Candidatus Sulfobium sp.]